MFGSTNFSLFIFLVVVLFHILFIFAFSEHSGSRENSNPEENMYANLFIMKRMKHLTAVNELKQMGNAVKRNQMISDLVKQIFHVLDTSRKIRAARNNVDHSMDLPDKDTIKYLENTAFFSDLLVFFPDLTFKLLEKQLLWRVTLIDSIQDIMSLNLKFVDENTLSQFDKAFNILSEGVPHEDQFPKVAKKAKAAKKSKKKPRFSLNEL